MKFPLLLKLPTPVTVRLSDTSPPVSSNSPLSGEEIVPSAVLNSKVAVKVVPAAKLHWPKPTEMGQPKVDPGAYEPVFWPVVPEKVAWSRSADALELANADKSTAPTVATEIDKPP
jgi:hypothetical protein